MRGKTIRQRIGELIAISHPDCKADLKKEANRIYGWSF
jgi:acyl-CoA hydrolase